MKSHGSAEASWEQSPQAFASRKIALQKFPHMNQGGRALGQAESPVLEPICLGMRLLLPHQLPGHVSLQNRASYSITCTP